MGKQIEEMLLVGEHAILSSNGDWKLWMWWKDRAGVIKDQTEISRGTGGELGLRLWLEKRLPASQLRDVTEA